MNLKSCQSKQDLAVFPSSDLHQANAQTLHAPTGQLKEAKRHRTNLTVLLTARLHIFMMYTVS